MLTLVIQAGGESKRMGQDKGLVPFLGRPLIQRVIARLAPIADEVIVTEFEFYRAASLEMLRHGNVLAIQDNHEAIRKGIALSLNGTCLITGSLYFISQVRQMILPEILGVKP